MSEIITARMEGGQLDGQTFTFPADVTRMIIAGAPVTYSMPGETQAGWQPPEPPGVNVWHDEGGWAYRLTRITDNGTRIFTWTDTPPPSQGPPDPALSP